MTRATVLLLTVAVAAERSLVAGPLLPDLLTVTVSPGTKFTF